MSSNFAHLRRYDEQLFRLGSLAERYFPEDPNTALLKLRQLGELLAQQVASRFGIQTPIEETQQLLLRRLEADGVLERDVAELFHVLRRKGNLANHDLHGDHATAPSSRPGHQRRTTALSSPAARTTCNCARSWPRCRKRCSASGPPRAWLKNNGR